MFNVFKKVTSAVVAGAVVLGTLAVYPNITKGKGSTVVSAAELPAVQDAASAVNYSSILGRGVDYGIIADNFQQRMHMQTTYAVKHFSTTCAGTPSEVNLTQDGSVAQFLVGGIVPSGEVVFGQTVSGPPYVFVGGDKTNILNFEGAAEVFATEPGQTQSNFKSQNFASEVLTTNTNTNGNIDLIMGDAFDSSASITTKAGSSAYAIDYHDYFTEKDSTHGTLNLDTGDFVNRVVYINVDDDLMNKISQSDGLEIIKDSSTVIVFNVGQDVSVVTPYYNETGLFGRFIAFNTYNVSVDGGANWIRTTSSTSKDKATRDLDREVCQKVIWNITTTKDVGLDATAGLFIIPNAYTDVVGSSAGWVVANNLSNTRGEWHYIYGGGNQNILDDEQGEIHFAARKTFTHEWDGEDTRDHEDTTIFTEAGKYSFYWYENDSSFSIDNPKDLDPSEYDTISNEATNKLLFPKLHFYNNEDKARAAGELDHYIPVNTDKTFYYTIREVGAGDKTSDGIELSTGYINITLTVKNVNGDLGYYVYSETYLGDGTFYERNAGVDENGDFIMNGSEYTQTRMSGVEFFLGEFFNLVDNALTLKKTVTGDYTPVAGDTFIYYVVNKADNKYYFLDSNNEIASSTEKVGISVEYGKEVLLSGLPAGEYTVSEDRYLAQRREYELNDPSAQDVTVNDSRVPVVNLVNDYTFNEDVIGKIRLTKTFEGIVTQEDLTGIKFTVSDKNGVIWEHKLGDSVFTVTKDQATGDIKYEAVIENLNISEDYKVVETMTVPEGYTFEKVSYVIGTDAEQSGFETSAFKPLPDGINVDYKDVYNRITGKLIVDKNLKDKEGKAITGFDNETFTFRVKAGDAGYLQKDGTIGTDPYEFTVTAGENANITVDYSAFNKTLTVEELDPNGVVIAGYDFVEDKYTNNGKSFGYPANDITTGIDNYYDFSTTPTGNIVITKTIEGPVTDKDKEGLTFEIYKVGETTPVWTGSLKETTGTSPKFIVDSTSGVYTSETITVETGEYYVVEKLTTDEGTVTVTYKLDNVDGTVTADYANKTVKTETFDVTKDADKALSFVNAYEGASLKINKTVTGKVKNNNFSFTVLGADGNYYNASGKSTGTTPSHITVVGGGSITIGNLPVQEYTVEETAPANNAADKWTFNADGSTQKVTKTVSTSSTVEADLDNIYTEIVPDTGKIVITKTIEGPVTEKDIEGLTFEVYSVNDTTTPVWTGSLKETTGSSPKFTVDSNGVYTSEEIEVETGKYYVVEKLTTDEGTVTVSYKLDNVDGRVTADYENKTVKTQTFDVDKAADKALTFVNTYTGADLKISKTVTGNTKVDSFDVTVKGADGNYYNANGESTGSTATYITVPSNGDVTVGKLPVQEYTVEEVDAAGNAADGWTFDSTNSAQSGKKTVSVTTTEEVKLNNIYTKNAPDTSNIVITKTIDGPVTEKDIEGLTFEVYSVNDTTTPVWTGTLKETTGSSPKFTIDASTGDYVSEKINVETGKYYVVEKLTTDEGTVTVTYKVDNTDGTVTADYANKNVKTETFDVTKDADTALTFVNTYVGADLKINKSLTGTAKSNTFAVTVKGADGNYYNASGKSTGATATNIDVTVGSTVIIPDLPIQEYTVEEVGAAANAEDGWTFDAQTSEQSVTKTIAVNTETIATVSNVYTKNEGNIVITKTIEGPVTEKDIEGLTFEVYKEGATTPVWTGTLKETTGSSPKFTVDASTGNYVSEKINVETGKYYVVEKLTTDEGTVTVTYKVDNTDGTVTADYANKNVKTETFDVTKDATTALSFVNAYVGADLKISKELTGSSKTTEFKVTVKGADGNYYDAKGNSTGSTATQITVSAGSSITVGKLPVQEYTVAEVGAAANAEDGWSLDSKASTQSVKKTVDANTTAEAKIVNVYTQNAPEKGDIVITKTIDGPVTEKDIEGLTFEVYMEGEATPVWTGTLKETTGSSPKFTVDASTGDYVSEKITVDTGKYYVVEKLTTDEGTVTVTYKVDNTDGTVTADYANKTVSTETFDVNKNATTALTFVNAYVGADLKINKSLTGTAKSNTFVVTVKGADGNYYNASGKSTGSTATNIDVTVGSTVIIPDLPVQEYTVEEVNAAGNAEDGWTFDAQASTQSVSKTIAVGTETIATVSNIYTKDAPDTSNIVITKTIEGPVTEKDIEGLTFEVYKEGDTTPVWTGSLKETTGSAPKFTVDASTGNYVSEKINVETGKYYVVEKLTTDEGTVTVTYKLDNVDGTITADYANKTVKTETFDVTKDADKALTFVNTYVGADLKISKTVTGNTKVDSFDVTVKGADGNYYDAKGNSTGSTATTITVPSNGDVTVGKLPVQEYTVEEVNPADNAADGWTFDSNASTKSDKKTVSVTSTVEAKLDNIYTENAPETGDIVITKTIEGPVTEKDIEGLTFEVYNENDTTTPVWTGTLKETTGTAPKFTVDSKGVYTSEKISVDEGTYYVVEKLTTDEGTVTVTYKVDNTDGTVTADYANKNVKTETFDVTKGSETALSFVNTYVGGSLKINKTLTGSAKTNTFTVTVKGADGNYYNESGKSTGTTATNIEVTVGTTKIIPGLPAQDYTVEEVGAAANAEDDWSFDSTQSSQTDTKTVEAGKDATAQISNVYTKNGPETGTIVITKTIEGPVTEKDIEGLTFELYKEGDTSPVWTGTLKDTTGSSPKFTVDTSTGVYTSEKIGVETGKYYVVEKLTTDEGTVTVTYKVDNTDGTVTADYANKNVKTETFDVAKDVETALSFVNTYVGADLKISKSVTGNTKSNSFKVTVKGADGNYYGLDGKSNGTTAVEINVPAGGSVTVGKLPVQEYTVEEIDAADNAEDGWTFDSKSSTQSGTKTVSVSTTAEVELSNVYTKNASDKSNIVITKTIEGPVTEKDIEGLTFELYKNGETTPVWTGSLKETTGTSPKFILDTTTGVYTSETISVDTGDYYVVEKLTTDEGTVTVTYKVNNTDGTVTADYANKNVKTETFNAAEDETTTLSFVNTYVGASLKIAKTVTGSVKNNNFMFTILGADGNYYNADGSSAGNTPAHIVVEGGKTTIAANLPVQEYTISEVNVADNAEDGWTFDADNSTQKVVKTPGAGSVTEIELNNIYTENKVPLTGTINVTKTVAGTDPTGSTYTFTVKCGDEYVQDLTGTMGTDAHSFSISDGDTITITGLEIGKTYVVEEAEVTGLPSGIVCSTTYSSSNQVVLDNTTTTGTVDITNTFTDTNNYNNGSLKVTKLVTGSTSTELPATFKFSVECDGQYVQQDGSLGTEKYLFEVTAGSDVTISNLDTDSKTYKVVEEEVTGLPTGYSCDEPQYSSQEVTLDSANDAGEVTITNNFNYDAPGPKPTTGSLSITKTIAGDVPAGSDSKTYSFTVTGPSYPNGTTVTVTGASTETLTDLEPGAYTVTEDETGSAFAEYDLTVSGDNNVAKNVVAGETAEFGITNTYKEKKQPEPVTGKLIFTKTFGGDVTEEEAAGDNLYFVITNSAGEYLNLDGTFSTDVVKITLKDLDHKDGTRVWTATINVPTGTYTVKEYNDEIYVNGSNVPYKMDSSSVRTATASIDTTVASSLTGNLDLTNVYVYDSNLDVTLSKEDVAGKEIAQAQLTFTSLNGYDLSNVEVTQGGTKVEYTVSPDKHAISFYTVETAPSIIKGLRAGDYKLEETVTPKAYLTADAIVFTLLPDGTTECNGQVSVQGSPIVMVDEADPKYNTDSHSEHDEDSIDDKEPDSIPATGEVTSVASKIGLIIIALSAVCFMGYFVFKKTKKEETAE